ncbi:MAG: hypothetical protein R2818_02275 [Flavobacteriales bacterium]
MEVFLANSGPEALELVFAKEEVHVIISDQRMPYDDGFGVPRHHKGALSNVYADAIDRFQDLEADGCGTSKGDIPMPPNLGRERSGPANSASV